MSEEIKNNPDFHIPDTLPLLPVKDVVMFPFMIAPLFVSREISISAINKALQNERLIFMSTQVDPEKEDLEKDDIFQTGTVGTIMRMLKLPDGRVKVLVQGLSRATVKKFKKVGEHIEVDIKPIIEDVEENPPIEIEALIRNVKDTLEKLSSLGKIIFPEVMVVIDSLNDPGRISDLVVANLGLKIEDAQELLEILNHEGRLRKVNELLVTELHVAQVQSKIQNQAREEIDKTQREYYLREQLKAIKSELGDIDETGDEIDEFREKLETMNLPEEVEKETIKQLNRLDMMHPDAAEAALIRSYLEWIFDLPWNKETKDSIDIKKAKIELDKDHYDLEKVKERMLEYLAVRKLKNTAKGPILCFVGPPGVGKTSLGRSIAKAMNRNFVRISLGGMRDEAEIRGHRRTYVGAMPGRIIQSMKQAGTKNPVIMLDEIDKLGMDFRGDPASALLEVLDPEQNINFSDHYLNIPFDLSKAMFIMTANQADPIPGPLLDRMELIELPGYTEEDKLVIAKKYIVPRQIKENGLKGKYIKITDAALKKIIGQYTREAGLRNLEREISTVCRKVAKLVAQGKKTLTNVDGKKLVEFLGPEVFIPEDEQTKNEVGIATGLAWTPVGGEILRIEATTMPGKGGLTLTGQLGDVMKESAQAAFSYTRSIAEKLGIEKDFHKDLDIHIHVPAGAIPKDGPSAGITMASALISIITKTPIKKDVAMTGEITLRGRVLPIGGLKEKCLAAMRAKMKTVIIPARNEKDLEDLPKVAKEKLRIVLASDMDDVLKEVLVQPKEKTKIKVRKKLKTKEARI